MHAQIEKPQFVVLICSYNNAWFYQANLLSALMQTYDNFRIIYIDDCSNDKTGELVAEFIRRIQPTQKITLIRNKMRKYKMRNLYEVIHSLCKNDEIIIELDGDDFLNGCDVLKKIALLYQENDILLTYGSYINFPYTNKINTEKLPRDISQNNAIRTYKWVTSHLKTFKASLFKSIPREHLQVDGTFVQMTSDLAYMFSMIELAKDKIMHCSEILYVYNTATSLNDDKVDATLQSNFEDKIRKKKPLTGKNH